ncbi:glycosyltransferase family 4 protein [Methylomagnum sp.]
MPDTSPPLFFITPAFGRAAVGGLGVAAERIAGHFASACPITVVTPTPDLPPHTHEFTESGGIPVVRVGRGGDGKLFLQYVADVLEALSRDHAPPRFLAFYCNELAYAASLAAARRGTAPLLFARGNDIDLEIFGEWAFHIHAALSRAEWAFCVSREMAGRIRAFCSEARPRYVPNGVDERAFEFQIDYAPNPRPVIGLFGDVKHKKGLDQLLAAVDFGRFDLRIVGNLREESRKLLHGFLSLRPDCHEHIATLPYTDDPATLRAHYARVDLVCIPSVHEGMSNVMLEAMAMGKACVGAAVGGALDVIRDGENGFLFEPRSVAGLSAALARAADCLEGEHETLRRRARETILEGYTAQQERKRYLRIFQQGQD